MVRFGSSSMIRAFIAKNGIFNASRPTPYTGHGTGQTKKRRSLKPMRRDLSAVVPARMQSRYSTTGKLLRFVAPGLTSSYRTNRIQPKPDLSSSNLAHVERLEEH